MANLWVLSDGALGIAAVVLFVLFVLLWNLIGEGRDRVERDTKPDDGSE